LLFTVLRVACAIYVKPAKAGRLRSHIVTNQDITPSLFLATTASCAFRDRLANEGSGSALSVCQESRHDPFISILGMVGNGISAYNVLSDTPIDGRTYDFNSPETRDLATLGQVSQDVGVAAAGAAAGATEALGSAASRVRIVPSGDGRIRLSSPQAGSIFPRPQPLVYEGIAKHAPGGYGTLMDLDQATAQSVLNRSVQVGRQRYAFHDGKLYEFESDNAGTWHGYPIPGNEAPPTALRQLVLRNDISPAEYNRLRKGK
jgi:hypothetical protein